MRGPDGARGKQRRWQCAIRNQTPKNEIAKVEYLLSVQLILCLILKDPDDLMNQLLGTLLVENKNLFVRL